MAIIAKCLLCEEKEIETFVSSSIIAKSDEEASQLLGMELVKHIMGSHPERLGQKPTGRIDKASGGMEMGMSGEIPQIAVMINGFLITRFFSSENEMFEVQKEEMRDKLCEAIMWGAPLEEEEELDEDPLPDEQEGAGIETVSNRT